MVEQVKNGLVPAAYRLMEDSRFQDWLLKVGLMKRSENWQEVQPVWENGGTDKILTYRERIIADMLLRNRGYIVAYTQIAHLDSKDCAHYSRVNVIRIKNKLENQKLISSACIGFGYGVGIESLRLQAQPGRLLYRLWQDLGNQIPWKELALGIYGYTDSDEYHGIRVLMQRLRHELISTRATILSYPQIPRRGGYTLMENDGVIS